MSNIIAWIAVVCVFTATILSAKKLKSNWIVYIISNVLWLIYGINTNQYPLIVINILLIIGNTYGLYKWTK